VGLELFLAAADEVAARRGGELGGIGESKRGSVGGIWADVLGRFWGNFLQAV